VTDSLLLSLDYLYVPAPNIQAAVRFYVEALGGEPRWRIRDGSVWVAAVRLAEPGPLVLLANHLEPGQLLHIYRTGSIADLQRRLTATGYSLEGEPFDIPSGPCVIFRDPGGQRLAAYERVRPEVDEVFEGRFDEYDNVTEP
jgi:predicted enzyme related to lactoylglutathione lyase